jgi:cob(I)alamin adenosyltransferase
MKIYTKTGDKGTTALIGGKRVPKDNLRIEAYGTVDELIAFIGLVRDHVSDIPIKNNLIKIQDDLMICSAVLATDCDDCEASIPKLSDESIVWLENEMDKMEEKLPILKSFILPGGHPSVSFCNVSRTVCRRAERIVYSLSRSSIVSEVILRYLNRLSDYLFVVTRQLSADNQVIEIHWPLRLD